MPSQRLRILFAQTRHNQLGVVQAGGIASQTAKAAHLSHTALPVHKQQLSIALVDSIIESKKVCTSTTTVELVTHHTVGLMVGPAFAQIRWEHPEA